MIGLTSETKDQPDGETAWIGIDLPTLRTETFWFAFNAGSPWVAKLLIGRIITDVHAEMEKIRREAYMQGWRDAKAKRRKADWWSGELP